MQKLNQFLEKAGVFYSKQFGFSPVAGRLLAYLYVAEPANQTIDELSENLQASRTAIVAATQVLQGYRLVNRYRKKGSKVDEVCLNLENDFESSFDKSKFTMQAELASQALQLLSKNDTARRKSLVDLNDLNEFLAERMPELYKQWLQMRQATG